MSVVSIVKLHKDDVEGAVRKGISLIQDFDSIKWKGSTVLVKPNTVDPSQSGSGRVTDKRVIAAVTKLVLEQNPGRVVIGEGSSVGYDFPGREDSLHCMRVAGVMDVAENLGVEVVDLNRDEQITVKTPEAYVMDSFSIAKTAFDADVIISLPVLKTHIRTGITCGLKNMKGVLPGDEKKRTHQCGLDRGIVDLNRVVKPHFTVVDGVVGLQGTNREKTDKVPLGIIVSGSDVVSVDAVCASVAGFNVEDILHVQLAQEAGLGVSDLDLIDVRGEEIDTVRQKFIPFLEAAKEVFGGATIFEENTCTGCMGELVSLFIYMRNAGLEEKLSDLAIIMGTPNGVKENDKSRLILGKCAKAFKHLGLFVPGCPPHGIEIAEGACDCLGIEKHILHKTIEKLHDF